MAIPVQAHPAVDQLEAFSRGTLADDAASQAISSHLEACPECLRTLANLSGDTLESLVRAAQLPGEGPTPLGSVHDAVANFSGAASAEAAADYLSFLAPPQGPDELGRLGSYRVLKVLGSGGMGVVFQAEDIHLKRRVALKVLKFRAASSPRAKERFLREAQAAAAIEHDHIVTIHQVGEDRGVPFLAMQWLKGLSLEDRLKQGGLLKAAQVVRLGRQIALGLAAAHEQGLIHRDIKPANLWLTPEEGGRIKILDFGLARALADDVHLTQS
ncbi:MAG TPA: protein kinase, partial [Gemmataceae bacterium]|nr:protein kinase [Gemmataceae bacterium]